MVINVVKLQITRTFSSAKQIKRIASAPPECLRLRCLKHCTAFSEKSRAKVIIIVETAKSLSSFH